MSRTYDLRWRKGRFSAEFVAGIPRRRDFIGGLVGMALAWPLVLHAQRDQTRRIAVLMGYPESDPEALSRLLAFKEGLAALGWSEGRNVRFDVRWGGNNPVRASAHAKELVALKPDLILANTTPATAALQRETRTIPIVFTLVADPVGSGFVQSFSRPGGNITGFLYLESTLVEKWLELLKEVAPRVRQIAVMFNPETAPYVDRYYLQPLRNVAAKLGVRIFPATVRSEADIEKTIASLQREADGGVMVGVDSFMFFNRKRVVALAAHYKVPVIYYLTLYVEEGGLIAYGVDAIELFRSAARHANRILRGAKPEDLPVEQPMRFELAINKKTAQELGITFPRSILIRADKVID